MHRQSKKGKRTMGPALATVLLGVCAVAIGGAIVLLARPDAEASPDVTITVNSQMDNDTRDDELTLREAMMLATGDLPLTELTEQECNQVSTAFWMPPCVAPPDPNAWPGPGTADTIDFDPAAFPSGAVNIILLGSALPTLDTGNDTVDGSSVTGPVVMGDQTCGCFGIWSHNNTVKGLALSNCEVGVVINRGDYNTIGGSNPDERNSISGSFSMGLMVWDSHHSTIQGNVISDSVGEGVHIGWGSDNIVRGNYIGTDATGNHAQSNGYAGIVIEASSGNLIEDNVISGNGGDGLVIGFSLVGFADPTNDNTIRGNYIGTDSSGLSAIPNGGHGIYIDGLQPEGANNNVVGGSPAGEANIIAFNDEDGVYVYGPFATGNTIRGNSIHSNGGKGIELGFDGNQELEAPIISGFGSVMGTACPDCTIDVYTDDEDEGEVYQGSTTADSSGEWEFTGSLPIGRNVTATATDSDGNTSEFSEPEEVPTPTPVSPTPEPDGPPPPGATGTPAPTASATGTPTATPPPSGTRAVTIPAGSWANFTWTGDSSADDVADCFVGGNVAVMYRLDAASGVFERWIRGRETLSTMGEVAQFDALLALNAGDEPATCYTPDPSPVSSQAVTIPAYSWANFAWTGDSSADDVANCFVGGNVAVMYRLDAASGVFERWIRGRAALSNMGDVAQFDAVLALNGGDQPATCQMPGG